LGSDDAGVEFADFDIGEEVGAGEGFGLLAEGGEFGLDGGGFGEAGAGGAGGTRFRIGEGVEVGVLGGGAGEEAVDEFAV
jgi:hypothetical protein